MPVDYQGHQIQLTGIFEQPSGSGPFPVVIALHDCAGPHPFYSSSLPIWVTLLRQQGYATLRLDSFTARGYDDICGFTKLVSAADRGQDVLAAASVLVGRSDVRPDRIAAIGWSHGGGSAVYAVRDHDELRPWREKLALRRGQLVAAVDLYGGCGRPDGYPVIVPLLFLAGAKDDWGALSCVQLANVQASGIMQVQVYPDVYHAFDIPFTARHYLGHTLAYDAAATADAQRRVFEFFGRFLR